MNKKRKRKITRVDIILVLILILIISLVAMLFSYAYFNISSLTDSTTSRVNADFQCLDVSYSETGSIELNKNYPVTDEYAIANFTPVTVTVTNNCSGSTGLNYSLTLSSIYQSLLNYENDYITDDKIRIRVLKDKGTEETTNVDTNFLSSITPVEEGTRNYKYVSDHFQEDESYANYTLKNIYNIDSNIINENEVITYKIYAWIDYFEGNPERISGDEYNNSTQGRKFEFSVALTLNSELAFPDQLIASNKLYKTGYEKDGYRFFGGENTNNYICFGTTDLATCKEAPDKYLYRIIGLFPDEKGINHLKLISSKQLGNYEWNINNINTTWGNNDLNKGLNGSYFLTNTKYEYMQKNSWLGKITDWNWTSVNTNSFTATPGPDFYGKLNVNQYYNYEFNRSNKISEIGEWNTTTAKIGLMNVSDYILAGELNEINQEDAVSNPEIQNLLKTSWINIINNDNTKSASEWTISQAGLKEQNYNAWIVQENGMVMDANINNKEIALRPVFYLTSDVEVSSGTGSLADPYLIKID